MKMQTWKQNLYDCTQEICSELAPFDSDHPTCPKCGGTMDFKGHDESGDFPFGEGYWVCSDCGFKITEDELWSSVRRE